MQEDDIKANVPSAISHCKIREQVCLKYWPPSDTRENADRMYPIANIIGPDYYLSVLAPILKGIQISRLDQNKMYPLPMRHIKLRRSSRMGKDARIARNGWCSQFRLGCESGDDDCHLNDQQEHLFFISIFTWLLTFDSLARS